MFLIRDHSRLSRPEAAGKIIKADDFWAFKEAERALADAHSKKEEIIASAEHAYEAERKRGYEEGSETAKLEQSGNMVEIVSQTVEYFGKVESEMVDLVLDAVRKVVNDFDDRQRVTTVVKNCLDLVRSQKHLSLCVHPSQVEYLRGQVSELQKIYPSISHIDVHPDHKLALDACVVESEIGVVEASLAGQVEALREALAVVFVPQEQPADDGDAVQADGECDGDDDGDDQDGGDGEEDEDGDDLDSDLDEDGLRVEPAMTRHVTPAMTRHVTPAITGPVMPDSIRHPSTQDRDDFDSDYPDRTRK